MLLRDIAAFHEKFELAYTGPPRQLPQDLYAFRFKFLKEELTEYTTALRTSHLADQLDALVDLAYVALGTAYLHGFEYVHVHWLTTSDLEPHFYRVRPGSELLSNDLENTLREQLSRSLAHYHVTMLLPEKAVWLYQLTHDAAATAYLHGFNFAEAWRRVQAANMRKIKAPSADHSKRGSAHDVVKPPGWRPPDLSDLVR